MKIIMSLLLTTAMSSLAFAESTANVDTSSLVPAEQLDYMMEFAEEGAMVSEGEYSIMSRHHRVRPPRRHQPSPRGTICYARNARGQYFYAQGRQRGAAHQQQRVMNRCYNVSRYCQPAGCRPLW